MAQKTSADNLPPERLAYGVREAAKTIGICHVTMCERINEGLIKTFLCGRRRLISRSALLKYIEEQERIAEMPGEG